MMASPSHRTKNDSVADGVRPADVTEAVLLRSARAGDSDALGTLLMRHQGRLLIAAQTHLGPGFHREEAEDLVQEGFQTVLLKFSTFDGDRGFGSWARGIVLNLCRNWLRKHGPADTGGENTMNLTKARAHHGPDPQAIADARERLSAVTKALELAGPRHRDVVAARVFAPSSAAAAQQLGVSPNAMRVRLSRARERLMVALPEVVDSL